MVGLEGRWIGLAQKIVLQVFARFPAASYMADLLSLRDGQFIEDEVVFPELQNESLRLQKLRPELISRSTKWCPLITPDVPLREGFP